MQMSSFRSRLSTLVTDERFKNIITTRNLESYYDVNGVNEAQNVYTLCWFLNPKGSHGLGDIFAREFVRHSWSTIHCNNLDTYNHLKAIPFYRDQDALKIENMNMGTCLIERTYQKDFPAVNFVMTDINTRMMIVVNNFYQASDCQDAYNYFSSDKFNYFTNKIFITFDRIAAELSNQNWLYLDNSWIINLTSHLINCPQFNNERVNGQLKEFFHFLTGTPYGMSHDYFAETYSGLVRDYYDTIVELRNYRPEGVSDKALVDISPITLATQYMKNIPAGDIEILNLFWANRSTFKTFFQIADYESVTKSVYKYVEKKNYTIDCQYTRNGLVFIPALNSNLDRLFMIETIWDMNDRLCLNLVINKSVWDRIPVAQRKVLSQKFNINADILRDRFIVNSLYFKNEWKSKDIGQEVINLCDKIHLTLQSLVIRAA
jgi:hypothetical protein